jgi:hypothetical protein
MGKHSRHPLDKARKTTLGVATAVGAMCIALAGAGTASAKSHNWETFPPNPFAANAYAGPQRTGFQATTVTFHHSAQRTDTKGGGPPTAAHGTTAVHGTTTRHGTATGQQTTNGLTTTAGQKTTGQKTTGQKTTTTDQTIGSASPGARPTSHRAS